MQDLFFLLFLLNLRGTVFFASIRLLKGVIGTSGCLALSFVLSLYVYPAEIYVGILDRPVFSIIVELLIGLFLGFSLSFLFEFVPYIGRLVDTFRGVQFQEQVAPELGVRDSRLEIYAGFFTVWIFFNHRVFSKFMEIYLNFTEKLGVGGFNGLSFLDISVLLNDKRGALIETLSNVFYSSLFIVGPLIIFSLIIELGLSILLKFNSKFHLGSDLNIIRAFAGLVAVPLMLSYSSNLEFALAKLLIVGKGYFAILIS